MKIGADKRKTQKKKQVFAYSAPL